MKIFLLHDFLDSTFLDLLKPILHHQIRLIQLFSDDGNKVFNVIKIGKLNQPEVLGKVAGEEILQKSGSSFVKKR